MLVFTKSELFRSILIAGIISTFSTTAYAGGGDVAPGPEQNVVNVAPNPGVGSAASAAMQAQQGPLSAAPQAILPAPQLPAVAPLVPPRDYRAERTQRRAERNQHIQNLFGHGMNFLNSEVQRHQAKKALKKANKNAANPPVEVTQIDPGVD